VCVCVCVCVCSCVCVCVCVCVLMCVCVHTHTLTQVDPYEELLRLRTIDLRERLEVCMHVSIFDHFVCCVYLSGYARTNSQV